MRRAVRGVSLIELIVVIVAMSAGLFLLGDAFLNAARAVDQNEDVQVAWQVAHSCADHVLGRVRAPGTFASVPVSPPAADACAALPASGTSTCSPQTVYAAVSAATAGVEPCAVGSCRSVVVCARRGGYDATVAFTFVER